MGSCWPLSCPHACHGYRYYDYQLSKLWQPSFNVQVCCVVFTGHWFCFQWQLVDLWCHWQQSGWKATILLPLETRKVACDNIEIQVPKLFSRSSVAPCLTVNHSLVLVMTVNTVCLLPVCRFLWGFTSPQTKSPCTHMELSMHFRVHDFKVWIIKKCVYIYSYTNTETQSVTLQIPSKVHAASASHSAEESRVKWRRT